MKLILKLTIAAIFILLSFCGKKRPYEPDAPILVCKEDGSYPLHTNAQRFGFFSEEIYKDYKAYLNTFTNKYGAQPGYIIRFQQIDDAFPTEFVNFFLSRSISSVISVNVMSMKAEKSRNDTLLREITSGIWDSTLNNFAEQARQINGKVYLRFGYEMNGDWFAWGKKPKEFIQAWNYVHKIFTRKGATNVKWIFSPGVLWDGATVENDLINYYPGDSVVDIVGLDGYNYGNIYKDGYQLRWKSFQQIFNVSLDAVSRFEKPLWITEVGCVSDRRRSEWLKDLFSFMESNPCIDAMIWFDCHKKNEPDFRMDSDSASFDLIKKWLQ